MTAPVRNGTITTHTTTVNGGTGQSQTVSHTEPSSAANDDLLVTISVNDELNPVPPTWSGPVGFDERADVGDSTADVALQIATRIRTGGETTPFVATADVSNNYCGVCDIVTGVNTTTPIDGVGTPNNNDSQLNHTAAERTTGADDCLCYAVVAWDGGHADTVSLSAASTSAGWVIVQEVNNDSGNSGVSALAIATKVQASAGATGDCVFVAANNISSVTIQFSIAPVSGTTVDMAKISFTQTLPASTVQKNTPITADAITYTQTIPAATLDLGFVVAMDALNYTLTLNSTSVGLGALFTADTVVYGLSLNAVSPLVDIPVQMDAISYTFDINDAETIVNQIALARVDYSLTIFDMLVSVSSISGAETWPASLPQLPLLRNRRQSHEDVMTRYGTGKGPNTVRARAGSAGETLTVRYPMTAAQYATFDTFWKTTLEQGTKRFTIPHPLSGSTVIVTMINVPAITMSLPKLIYVDLQLFMEA